MASPDFHTFTFAFVSGAIEYFVHYKMSMLHASSFSMGPVLLWENVHSAAGQEGRQAGRGNRKAVSVCHSFVTSMQMQSYALHFKLL